MIRSSDIAARLPLSRLLSAATATIVLLSPVGAGDLVVDERPARAGEWGLRPAEGAAVEVNPPAFVWRPQEGAVSYEWQATRGGSFELVERSAEIERYSVHCPPTPFEAGEWGWRFRFLTKQGARSAWSRTRTFIIDGAAPVFAIPARDELLSRVPRAHPRLFVRPEDLPALRQRTTGDLREPWEALVARCEKLCAKPPSTAEPPKYPAGTVRGSEDWRAIWWGNRKLTIAVLESSAQLAFAWRVGGDERYAEQARELLMAAATWDPKGATGYRYNDEAGMPYAYHFSRTYTFLHDFLSEGERGACRAVMAARGREMYEHLSPRHLWKPYSSHSNRAWHFLGEVGIAFLGEVEGAEDWLDFAMRVFGAAYPVWSDSDGGWHEGLAYWRSYLGRFTWWADVMRSAVGVDAYQVPFFSRVGDFALYVQPPGTRGGGFGDLCGRLESSGNVELVRLFARQARNPHWQWYAEAHGPAKVEADYIAFLRSASQAVEARSPTGLPSSKLFEGTGVAVLNRTLEGAADNVQLIFKSSPFGTQSHGYEAQNSFLLYAFGERLAIRSGRRDSYGSEHHKRWMWSTRSTNSITVSGGKGQLPRSAEATGRIVEFYSDADFDYVEGEASAAYGGRVERFTRSVLFAKPDTILIYDRLRTPAPETFEWWLHAEHEMAPLEDGRYRLQSGAAACEVQWLWPRELELAQTDQFDPPPRPRVKLVEHHLTASTLAPATSAVFITVLRPRRVGEPVAPRARLIEGPGGFRVELADSAGPLAILLAGDEGGSSAVTAERPGTDEYPGPRFRSARR